MRADLARLPADLITDLYIDEILKGKIMDTEEIVIPEDAPGAAPMPQGGFGSVIGLLMKFGPAIQSFVAGLISGTATFVVAYHGLKRWVSISEKPPSVVE